jgi:hypothetical protein
MSVDRNINVLCTRRDCQTSFVTSFDSFMGEEKVSCPKCGESWAVHMTYEDGRLIHPTDICPTCLAPTLLMEYCRCTRHTTKCVNGHESQICPVHEKRVPGNDHSMSGDCVCGAP